MTALDQPESTEPPADKSAGSPQASPNSAGAGIEKLISVRSAVSPAVGFLIGLAVTAAVVWFLVRGSVGVVDELNLGLLALSAIVGVPVMVFLNGLELRQIGRLAGCTLRLGRCVQLALLAGAANALPIPGAAVVRIAFIHRAGATLAAATRSNIVAILTWCAVVLVAFGAVGLSGSGAGVSIPGSVLLLGGGVAAAAFAVVLAGAGSTRSDWAKLLLIEVLVVAADVARYVVVLKALGSPTSVLHGLSMSAAGLITSLIGIVPAGLGVREALAAFMGAVVDLDPRVAIAASASDRVATLLVLGAMVVPVLPRLRALLNETSP